MQHVTNFINAIPNGFWAAILASPILSGLLQSIKHWLSIQSEKVMVILLACGAGLAAAGYYLLTVPSNNPSIIAYQGAALAFTTTPFYYFLVKPLYKKFVTTVTDANHYHDEVKSAAIPPEGVPLSGTVVSSINIQTPQEAFKQSVTLDTFDH